MGAGLVKIVFMTIAFSFPKGENLTSVFISFMLTTEFTKIQGKSLRGACFYWGLKLALKSSISFNLSVHQKINLLSLSDSAETSTQIFIN